MKVNISKELANIKTPSVVISGGNGSDNYLSSLISLTEFELRKPLTLVMG